MEFCPVNFIASVNVDSVATSIFSMHMSFGIDSYSHLDRGHVRPIRQKSIEREDGPGFPKNLLTNVPEEAREILAQNTWNPDSRGREASDRALIVGKILRIGAVEPGASGVSMDVKLSSGETIVVSVDPETARTLWRRPADNRYVYFNEARCITPLEEERSLLWARTACAEKPVSNGQSAGPRYVPAHDREVWQNRRSDWNFNQ